MKQDSSLDTYLKQSLRTVNHDTEVTYVVTLPGGFQEEEIDLLNDMIQDTLLTALVHLAVIR